LLHTSPKSLKHRLLECNYYRLIYSEDTVRLEGMIPILCDRIGIESSLSELFFIAAYLGGALQVQTSIDGRAMQVMLKMVLST